MIQIAKTLGSTSIRYRSLSRRIDVNPMVFAIRGLSDRLFLALSVTLRTHRLAAHCGLEKPKISL